MTTIAEGGAASEGAVGPTGRRWALPRMTRSLARETLMAAYGAAMLTWMLAVVFGAAGGGTLSALATVFGAWAAGTVPACLVASLATRRLPAA